MAGPSLRPSSWPPGVCGRWLTVALVGVATVGGAGGGLAALVGAVRGDDQGRVVERLDAMSGRLERVEEGQRTTAERLVELRATVEAREQARREQQDLARSYLRGRSPDPARALDALGGEE